MASWWLNGSSVVIPCEGSSPVVTIRTGVSDTNSEATVCSDPNSVSRSLKYNQMKNFWASGASRASMGEKTGSSNSLQLEYPCDLQCQQDTFNRPPTTSISTLTASCSGSGSNSAEDFYNSSREDFRGLKQASTPILKGLDLLDDEDCSSCYSHASAIDLSTIVLPMSDLCLSETLNPAIVHSLSQKDILTSAILEPGSPKEELPDGSSGRHTPLTQKYPGPAPELPKFSDVIEHIQIGRILRDSDARNSLATPQEGQELDIQDQEEDPALPVPVVRPSVSQAPRTHTDVSNDDLSENNLEGIAGNASQRESERGEIGDALGIHDVDRRCSFAESFARRDMIGSKKGRKAKRKNTKSRKQKYSAVDLVDRASVALAELLDQNKLAAERLTDGTRAFATVFSINEKHVFGSVVRGALRIIRVGTRTGGKEKARDHRLRTHPSNNSISSTHSTTRDPESSHPNKQLILVPGSSTGKDNSTSYSQAGYTRRGVTRTVTNADLARKILFGVVSNVKKTSIPSRRFGSPQVMMITDGKSNTSLPADRKERSRRLTTLETTLEIPKGPLTFSVANETIDVQLPFGASLLAVLAVLARLDCELIFKKRKNMSADAIDRRGKSAAVVHAKARQDRSGRHFIFSVFISGTSPTRIAFRRPRFISLRRVDDYVDIVVDSKELISEFCLGIWGRDQ